jgi:hypothetical protein
MKSSLKLWDAYGRMSETATAGMTQAAIQYLSALLLFVDRMKMESSVIRRTPPHRMARPTFESITGTSSRRNEFALGKQAGKLLGGGV